MEITEVRVKLVNDAQERLLAFCSITIDGAFVIRDLKLISGTKGPFVAMPSRKLCDRCPHCGYKNHLRAHYCCHCGQEQIASRADQDEQGRSKLYADIAHPINSRCRDLIQNTVLHAYEEELILSQQEGYASRYDDFSDWNDDDEVGSWDASVPLSQHQQRLDAPSRPAGPHAATSSRTLAPALRKDERDEFGAGIFS